MTTVPQRVYKRQHRFSKISALPDRIKSRHLPMSYPNLTQQQAWGNQAMQRLLNTRAIQAKLPVNELGDKYEQEADRVADLVMGLPVSTIQRPTMPSIVPKVVGNSTGLGEAPPNVHDVLTSSGHPLDTTTRAFFEPRLGHDFSQVRVHIDSDAADSARSIHAHAYTVNHHIVFGADKLGTDKLGTGIDSLI